MSNPTPEPRPFITAADAGRLDPYLDDLCRRGYRGWLIHPHRALRHSPCPRTRLASAIVLALGLFLLWYALLGPVAVVWREMMEFCRAALGMSGYTTMVPYQLGPFHFDIPYMHFGAAFPRNIHWWGGMVVMAVLIFSSFLIRRRYLPLVYFLRVTALFHGTAQLYFAVWQYQFPYRAAGYVHGLLIASLMFIAIIPIVLGFTYFLFDFPWRHKLRLSLLMMLHMTVLVPLQYFLHGWALHHLTLLYMPLLFFIFGLPANVMMFIALFGWGFSWENLWDREADPDPPPRRKAPEMPGTTAIPDPEGEHAV